MNWMVPQARLDERQLEVLRLCGNGIRNQWITGCAGTGKTVLLVHLIDRIRGNDDNATVCVATFTHALKDLVSTGMAEALRRDVPVMTYVQLLREQREFDWILLDEVQDIKAGDLSRVELLARRCVVVVAGDAAQSIYDGRVAEPDVRRCLDLAPKSHDLGVLYRLPQSIRDVASCILPDARLEAAATSRLQDVAVTLARAKSAGQEVEWVWERLKKYSRGGQPAVVLWSTHKEVRRFFRCVCTLKDKDPPPFGRDYDLWNEWLAEQQIPLQYLGNDYGRLEDSDSRDLAYVMTYHSAKGLDFETVFLPGLTERREFWKDDENIARRLFYVGLTRSRRNLFLSYHGAEHAYVKEITGKRGDLLHRVECAKDEAEASPQVDYF